MRAFWREANASARQKNLASQGYRARVLVQSSRGGFNPASIDKLLHNRHSVAQKYVYTYFCVSTKLPVLAVSLIGSLGVTLSD
jgi:hypothetical protein